MTSVLSHPEFERHELVQFVSDERSGLRAIIVLHSTVLGPAGGGIRFFPFPDEASALTDALRLSKAMTAKMALGGVPMGGGKSIILGDPTVLKTDALLRAFGRAVDALGGRYICGEDMGVTPQDMDVIGTETRWAVGQASGTGDTSPLTAVTVREAMRAAAQHVWGSDDLGRRTIAIQGLGAVGANLARLLLADGARVVGSDVDETARAAAAAEGVEIVDPGTLLSRPVDVLAPCAFGAVLNEDSIPSVGAKVVCGAANNQLATTADGDRLSRAGVVYVPDFVANIGGVYSAVPGLPGKTQDDAEVKASQVFARVLGLLETAEAECITPAAAADRRVREILEQAQSSARSR